MTPPLRLILPGTGATQNQQTFIIFFTFQSVQSCCCSKMKSTEKMFLESDETVQVGRSLISRLIDGSISAGYIPVSWNGNQYSFRQGQDQEI